MRPFLRMVGEVSLSLQSRLECHPEWSAVEPKDPVPIFPAESPALLLCGAYMSLCNALLLLHKIADFLEKAYVRRAF